MVVPVKWKELIDQSLIYCFPFSNVSEEEPMPNGTFYEASEKVGCQSYQIQQSHHKICTEPV
jgi:hypothetical protein